MQSALVLHGWSARSQFDGVAGTTHASADTRCGNTSPHFSQPDGTGGSTKPCINCVHAGSPVSPVELLPSLVPLLDSAPLDPLVVSPVVVGRPVLPVDADCVVSPLPVSLALPVPPEPHAPSSPSARNNESRAGSMEAWRVSVMPRTVARAPPRFKHDPRRPTRARRGFTRKP